MLGCIVWLPCCRSLLLSACCSRLRPFSQGHKPGSLLSHPLPRPACCSELERRGLQASFVEEEVEAASVGKGSVAVGEVADNIEADLVVLSTAAIHEKHVVSCRC